MKKILLFEQFINESERMETFLNTKMKNPVSGREVKVSSMINDESNPLYKKLQAKKAEIDGGGDDEGGDEKNCKVHIQKSLMKLKN